MVAIGVLSADTSGCNYGCAFDADAWRESRSLGGSAQFEQAEDVVEDLVKCDGLLYGKSPAEVRQKLGPPDKETRTPTTWEYDVGIPKELSDYPRLEIVYGSDVRVDEVSVPSYVER
jgi:hypothetical protein